MIGYILLGILLALMIGIACFFAGIRYGVNKMYKILYDMIFDATLEEIGAMFVKLGYIEQFKEAMNEFSKEHKNEQTK